MKMKWEEKFIELYTKGKVQEAKDLKIYMFQVSYTNTKK